MMFRRVVAFIISIALSCGQLVSYAAWDGYRDSCGNEQTEEIMTVVDMNKIGDIFSSGAVPSDKITKSAQYSCAWSDMVGIKNIRFDNVPRDWSGCDTLSVNMYSKKATGTEFIFAIWCDLVPISGAKNSYYSYTVKIDWEGWKTFNLSLKNDFSRANLASLEKVNYIRITNDGWGCVASPDAEIYIDSITVKRDAQGEDDSAQAVTIPYNEKDKERFSEIAKNAVGVVEYSRNVYKNGIVEKQDEYNPYAKVITRNSEGYIPIEFFKKYFDKDVPIEDSYIENNTIYVPILKTAVKLNIKAEKYDSLYLFGNDVDFDKIDYDENARIAGAYIICETENVSITDDELKKIADRWRYDLVGDENNDSSDPIVAKAIDTISENGQSAWDAFRKNSVDKKMLFSEVTTTAQMTQQYEFIADMAKAYGTKGSTLYKSKKLKKDIIAALDLGYELLYGDDEMNERGWRDVSLYNWWDWGVGVPMQMLDAIMIIQNEVSQEKIDKWIEPIFYLTETQVATSKDRGAQSMLATSLGLSLLGKKQDVFQNTIWYLDELLRYTDPRGNGVNGLKFDGTYTAHNDFAYNAGYGVSLIGERGCGTLSSFANTGVEIATPNLSHMLVSIYDTFEPVLYEGGLMSAFIGRSVGKELSQTNSLLSYLLDVIGVFGEEHDKRIKEIIKRNVKEGNEKTLISILGVKQARILSDILNDESISGENTYERAKMYNNGDKAVWHSNGYAAALSMCSERQAAWESINGMNLDGWYVSDGALFTYTDDNFLPFGSSWWTARNPYHIPGTTTDTQERQAVSVIHTEDYLNSQDFVGGTSLEDRFMTAAMSLESFHNETYTGVKDQGYGGAMPLHKSTLTAKKSYFFFDNEIVAIGSDIDANDDAEVQTTIDNRKLYKRGIPNKSLKELNIVSITSSGDDGNGVENVLDNNLDTRWSMAGTEGCYFIAELENPETVSHIGVAFYKAINGNSAIFDIEFSLDGVNWEKVSSCESNGTDIKMEAFKTNNKTAKFIKYNGHGRKNSVWNSVTEFKVYAPSEDGSIKVAFSDDDETIYGTEDIVVDGISLEKVNSYDKEFENPQYAYIEGVGGYCFMNADKLFVKKTGSYNNFCEMWLSHGINPQNKKYEYVVLPGKSEQDTAQYSNNPDVTVLNNDEKIQAVRENKLNSTGIVFWQAGKFGIVETDKPIICMYKESDNVLSFTVCEPTGKLDLCNIMIEGEFDVISADKDISISSENNQTRLALDCKNSYGKSYQLTLKRK